MIRNLFFKKIVLFSFLLLINSLILADATVTSLAAHNESGEHASEYEWRNSSYLGYSWTTNSGFKNPDTTKFKQVAGSETDDGTLNGTSYAGIGLNKKVHEWLMLGVSYEIYNNFAYQNAHVTSSGNPPLAGGGELFGDKYTRSFSLVHQSALFNAYLNWPDRWALVVSKFKIKQIVGGGLGVGINYLTGFQTVGLSAVAPYTQITTVGLAALKNSLAWYVNIGLGFQPKNTAATFGLAYRYYNGGAFSSGSQFIFYDPTNGGELLDLTPWTGVLKANEVKIFLDFDF